MTDLLAQGRAQLAAARWFLDHADAGPAGVWPRAAAVLARQALGSGFAALWSIRAPGLAQTTARCQLSCLPSVLRDDATAGEAAYTWSMLSRACHHRTYELAPTASELQARLGAVQRVLGVIERRCGSAAGSSSSTLAGG